MPTPAETLQAIVDRLTSGGYGGAAPPPVYGTGPETNFFPPTQPGTGGNGSGGSGRDWRQRWKGNRDRRGGQSMTFADDPGSTGLPSGNPGGVPVDPVPNAGRFAQLTGPAGSIGDDRTEAGGSGFSTANGAPATSNGQSIADILAAASQNKPHGYTELGQYFDPVQMGIGAAIGQLPMGGTAASILGPIASTMWNQKEGPYYAGATMKPADVAKGFASSLPTGGLMKLAEWYAGTPYAKAHPVASYYNGGNAESQAANLADTLWSKYGASPGTMTTAYNELLAQKNLGGAGNPKAVEDRYLGEAQQTLDNITGGLQSQGFNPEQVQSYTENYGKMGQDYESMLAGGPQAAGNMDSGLEPGISSDVQSALDAGGGMASGDSASWDSDASDNQSIADAMGPDWGFAKGGTVRRPRPGMPNPPGPDDQYIAAKTNEAVLTAATARKLGPALIRKLNSGKFDRDRLVAALKVKAA